MAGKLISEFEDIIEITQDTYILGQTIEGTRKIKASTFKGDKGDKGDKGEQGLRGERGIQGEQGIQGQKGDTGVKGDTGAKGDQGLKGDTGATGSKGDSGKSIEYVWRGTELGIRQEGQTSYIYVDLQGPQGEQGLPGVGGGGGGTSGREIELQKGTTHIQWRYVGETSWRNLIAIVELKGDKGDKGETGAIGPQGIPGEQGIQGAKGDKGDKGDTGTIGPQGLKGDKGDTGPQGLKGEQGLKGDKGDTGQQGIAGTNGTDGITPNIQIGTVTTGVAGSNATVTRRGTNERPIFDFAIPRGDKGEAGTGGNVDLNNYYTKTQADAKFELKATLVTTLLGAETLQLTTDKYQISEMRDAVEISLPSVDKFTEIHLFFSATADLTLIFPSVKWQTTPSIVANKTYEFIFTYTTEWLGGVVVYE